MERRPSRAKQLAAAMRENVRIPRECHPATLRVLVQRGHAHLFDDGYVLEAQLGKVLESLARGERKQLKAGIAGPPDREKIIYSFDRLEGFVKFIRRNRPLVEKLIRDYSQTKSAPQPHTERRKYLSIKTQEPIDDDYSNRCAGGRQAIL